MMRGTQKLLALIAILTMLVSLSLAQEPTKQSKKQTLIPSAGSNPVVGNGTAANPLATAVGGVQTIHLANYAITSAKLANGTAVRNLNGLTDAVKTSNRNALRLNLQRALRSIT